MQKSNQKGLEIQALKGSSKFGLQTFEDKQFQITYPQGILNSLSDENKKILIDNFIFCRTTALRLFFNELNYKNDRPYLENFIIKAALNDLPRLAYIDKKIAADFVKKFKKSKATFKNDNRAQRLSINTKHDDNSAILSFSFGKDSLLSYALIKEIGVNYKLISFNVGIPNELTLKNKAIEDFSNEQNETIINLDENTDEIYSKDNLPNTIECLDYSSAMLSFALQLMPFACHFSAKYIVFGNEKNMDYSFRDKEKCKVYPSYDQSTDFMKLQKKYLRKFTKNNIQVISPIKPLHDIACFKIICDRYPHLLKYMLSCENDPASRWCENCNMCARAFLFSVPLIDTSKLGFEHNLFDAKYKDIYVLFSDKITSSYAQPKETREEQLTGFLMAYKKGLKGELIDLFKKTHLKEAEKREKYLRKKYFSYNFDGNMPKDMAKKLKSIYKEELDQCLT